MVRPAGQRSNSAGSQAIGVTVAYWIPNPAAGVRLPHSLQGDDLPSKEGGMPFKSEKQRRYMWANHPKIARKWANEAKRKRRKKK